MGSTGLLLRQRGCGNVDAVRRPNGRRMASVRAHSVVTRVINRARTYEHIHGSVIKEFHINYNYIIQYDVINNKQIK